VSMAVTTKLVVIPMKDPQLAKTRLAGPKAKGTSAIMGGGLDDDSRAALAASLFSNLLIQLLRLKSHCRHGFDIATVTASAEIARRARHCGINVIAEGQILGLNNALNLAADWATQRGYRSLAVLPGDLARPQRHDLQQLLDRPENGREAVICTAKDGGTNALLLPLPVRIGFCYGENSGQSHRTALLQAGLRVRMPVLDSLRHDIDRPEDLREMGVDSALEPLLSSQPEALIGDET
jgi:2-phospho-L-lactate guanylyltransferase